MGCITSQESKTVTPDASLADSTDGIGNTTTGLRYRTHGPDGRHTPAGQDTKDSGDKAGTTGSRRDQREIKMANTATALTEPGVEENVLREVGVSKIGSSLPNDDSALDRGSLASRAEFSRTNAHAPVHSSFTQVQVGLRWPEWFEKESQDISRHGAPRHIKDFKKVRRIGRGAYSTVYLGLDLGEGIIKGHNEVEQIHRLLQLCGSWEEGYAEKINLKNDKLLWTLTKKYPSRLHDIPNITVEATKLLEIIMNVQPERRGTAFGALRHEYFDQLDSGDNSQRLGDNDVGGIVRSIMASRNASEMSDTDFSGKGDTGEVTHENE